jgi:[ribosomal protein S5]-alanine N-acetyltransferase
MPSEQLETERLILRPPKPGDVPRFVPLLADYDVAKNLSTAPHPYTEEAGHAYVARAAEKRAKGLNYSFAVLRKDDDAYIGACGVHPERDWEFGYWIGKPYWGLGYATEAARRVVRFAFEELNAEYLSAGWFHDNPASSRVLEKLGCVPLGQEERDCLARGAATICNRVILTRARWEEAVR